LQRFAALLARRRSLLKDALKQLRQFHETFRCHIEYAPTADIARDEFEVRIRLFEEELAEYRRAVEAKDLVAVADALTDMLYILLGTYVTHGLQDVAVELFDEVHRSNMSKLDEHGRPIVREDGKVLKSDRFSKPDLESILVKHLS
jgi:predicted HAD superfamily Cof-like phosphohydrolase